MQGLCQDVRVGRVQPVFLVVAWYGLRYLKAKLRIKADRLIIICLHMQHCVLYDRVFSCLQQSPLQQP